MKINNPRWRLREQIRRALIDKGFKQLADGAELLTALAELVEELARQRKGR